MEQFMCGAIGNKYYGCGEEINESEFGYVDSNGNALNDLGEFWIPEIGTGVIMHSDCADNAGFELA